MGPEASPVWARGASVSAWRLVPMHDAQLAQVLDIETRAYAFPWTDGIFRDCLKSGYSAWVVQSAEGTMLGYAVMSMAVGEAHVLNLAVDPVRRRQGLARFLLMHLLQLARAAHCTI
ncbi:MAG: GNAT family N-acetyltransferase, partial [Panacagrimonas sp.]